jgi:hypothetical protein
MNDDIKKQAEAFHFHYLPAAVATAYREALDCYRRGLMHAYAQMCRQTILAIVDDLGEAAQFKIYDQVDEIAALANIDDHMHREIREILFEGENTAQLHPNGFDRETAAVLLETMKDILHQAYVRRALLRQKLKMRRYFANQSDELLDDASEPNVSPFKRPAS